MIWIYEQLDYKSSLCGAVNNLKSQCEIFVFLQLSNNDDVRELQTGHKANRVTLFNFFIFDCKPLSIISGIQFSCHCSSSLFPDVPWRDGFLIRVHTDERRDVALNLELGQKSFLSEDQIFQRKVVPVLQNCSVITPSSTRKLYRGRNSLSLDLSFSIVSRKD